VLIIFVVASESRAVPGTPLVSEGSAYLAVAGEAGASPCDSAGVVVLPHGGVDRMLTRATAGVEVGDESVAHIPGGEFRGWWLLRDLE